MGVEETERGFNLDCPVTHMSDLFYYHCIRSVPLSKSPSVPLFPPKADPRLKGENPPPAKKWSTNLPGEPPEDKIGPDDKGGKGGKTTRSFIAFTGLPGEPPGYAKSDNDKRGGESALDPGCRAGMTNEILDAARASPRLEDRIPG